MDIKNKHKTLILASRTEVLANLLAEEFVPLSIECYAAEVITIYLVIFLKLFFCSSIMYRSYMFCFALTFCFF